MLLCFFCLVFKKSLHWSIHCRRRATANKVKCQTLSVGVTLVKLITISSPELSFSVHVKPSQQPVKPSRCKKTPREVRWSSQRTTRKLLLQKKNLFAPNPVNNPNSLIWNVKILHAIGNWLLGGNQVTENSWYSKGSKWHKNGWGTFL